MLERSSAELAAHSQVRVRSVPSQSLFHTVLVLVYRLGLHLNVTIPVAYDWAVPVTVRGAAMDRSASTSPARVARHRTPGPRPSRIMAASSSGGHRGPVAQAGPGAAFKEARPLRWRWRTWPSLGQWGTRAPLAPGRAVGGKGAHPRLPHQDI